MADAPDIVDSKDAASKVVFVDVDGTLVNYEGAVPESAAEAVRTARANGHKVYLCTGRSEGEIYDDIRAIGFDGLIGANGAYVRDGDEILWHESLSEDQCAAVVDWLSSHKLPFYLESNAGLFGSRDFKEGAAEAVRAYSASTGGPSDLTVDEAFPEMVYDAPLVRDDVNKISFVLRDYRDVLDAARIFSDLEVGTWGGRGAEALFGDIGLPEVSKADGIRIILERLGVPAEEAVAIGDAHVDIPMFELCGTGIAMGDGTAEARAAADFVTDDVDADGLAHAFDRLGLL